MRIHDDVTDDDVTYPPHPAGEERESIFFELHHGTKEIGGYRLDREIDQTANNQWALNDRMVLSADPSLELDYAVVKRDNGKWEPQQYKDLYVFPKGTELKSEVSAFRINLEKTFVPSTNAVERQSASI